jgi:NADPH2:quinone reductase
MKAIRIHTHGGPEVLQIDDIPVPQPKSDEVLIRIKAAALNHLDIWVRKGIPGLSLPLIMGSDGAGVIETIGDKVSLTEKFAIGDEVFLVPFRTSGSDETREELSDSYIILGEQIDGSQAEWVSAPADFIMHKPKNLTIEETAAFPLAYMTAYHMLVKKTQLEEGQTVLIWGASSGVGSAAIQIAKEYQTSVITTAGTPEKAEFATRLGADYVINYNKENVSELIRTITQNEGVDVVFEHIGEQSWTHSLRSLKKGGKIVVCGSTTGPRVNLDLRHIYIKHQQIIGSTMGNRQDLAELVDLIEQEKIKPLIGSIVPYSEIQKAHQILENNEQMGKVVIQF